MPGSTPSRSSRNCYVSLIPMSERQQLKLVRQLETSDNRGGNSGRDSGTHRPRSRSCNGRGETPLHKAAIRGDEELVVKLLEEGADPNTPDFAGWTPLHEACNHGWYGVALALVQAGASVNARGFDDDTPLHDAAINGHSKAHEEYSQNNSNWYLGLSDDIKTLFGRLFIPLVRLLVESGADVYSRNKGGKTPCDVAAPGLMPHLLKSQASENAELGSKKSDVSGGSTEADNTAISEMRRTPPQTKVDKSPRVTLRLHQIKKKSGKLNSEATTYSNSRFQFSVNMEEKTSKEDVYEFKSSKEATPVRGSSTSPDVDKTSGDAKAEKAGESFPTESESQSLKRNISEVTESEENDEDNKKKKRKEGDRDGKDVGGSKAASSGGRMNAVRNVNNNSEKSGKVGHLVNKAAAQGTPKPALTGAASAVNVDRKSPSSPKGNGASATANAPSNGNNNNGSNNNNGGGNSTSNSNNNNNNSTATPNNNNNNNNNNGNNGSASNNNGGNNNNNSNNNNGGVKVEGEQEDKTNSDGDKIDPGPKVPPLKIVIPQQSGAEPEQGNRNGKNSTSRHHQALPYVVSSNSNDSEKDGPRSRSVSPTDSVKSDEKKDGMLSSEEQKNSLHHQRVLRSAHRSGPGGNGESRFSENPPTPRNGSNGNNGQVANTNSGSTSTVMTSSTSTASGATTTTMTTAISSGENPSPPAQSQTSPSPTGEAHPVTNSTTSSTSSESSASNTGNYRSNTVSTTKSTTTVSCSSVAAPGSEEKASEAGGESGSAPAQQSAQTPAAVELHPRKRKLKHNKEVKEPPPGQVVSERCESAGASTEVHPHDQPVKNCYQLFLDIRKQIDRRRKGLFPVQPKPPQGFKDYLMNRCTYVLAGNASTRQIPSSPMPQNLAQPIKELFVEQEKERHRLRLQHVIEKEKLVLSVEQEILRVHGRAARALANQSLPFSACTILKDEEVYNLITPEQEEKDRNARSRYNGRLFLSWLQDVDDKWEKIKEAMLLRHHNEAESLHAVQKMDWEWKMKELGLCEFKSKPVILDSHVPMVNVSDDFDLLPA